MEIPSNLKSLYKHWGKHTLQPISSKEAVELDKKILSEIQDFAIERQLIWEKKTKGLDWPYTNDKVLQTYKFCNIYRELDRQTIEIHTLLKNHENDLDLWLLNVLFCRLICNTETVKKVGLLSYSAKHNLIVYKKLQSLARPKYGSAYIFPVSLIMKTKYPTREEFFCKYLPKVTRECAKIIKSFENKSVPEALALILPTFGFNLKFHWTESLIDTAYQFPEYIDLYKRFPIGPGSIPTMKLLSKEVNPENTCLALSQTPFPQFPHLTYNEKPVLLSAENWEGVGCEYRKYKNLKSGKGRRRLYKYKI